MFSHEDMARSLGTWNAASPGKAKTKLSIVTPSFNQERFLEHTIRSVLDQDYPDLEYVVVDGGSHDASPQIIERYADRLHWWTSEPDGGPEEAINKGFSHTSGEIMGWIGASDKYLPWAFSVVAHIFEQFPEIKWLTTLYPVQWNESGQVSGFHFLPAFYRAGFFEGEYLNIGESSQARGWIQAESTFWRRSLWERAGGGLDTTQHASDFDLWARFFRRTKLWGVAVPLGGWRLEGPERGRGDENAYLDSARSALRRYDRGLARLDPARWLQSHRLKARGPVLAPGAEGNCFIKSLVPIDGQCYETVCPSLFGLDSIQDPS